MKLLIITQIVDKNDSVLGFFHSWIEEFSKNFDQVAVICLKKGEYDLPKNVKVLSLGKEEGVSKFKYLLRFYKYIWNERKNYDNVFVHMNPEYVILGVPVWRILRKKTALWYAHGTVTLKLILSVFLANLIFTSTHRGCRVSSKKVKIVGQGIDCNKFAFCNDLDLSNVCTVGRISKTKNIEIIIESIRLLKKEGIDLTFNVYGETLTREDVVYKSELELLVKKGGLAKNVFFNGNVTQNNLPNVLCKNGIFISASQTGSLDKAILEASATGRIVISSNVGAKDFLLNVDKKLTIENTSESFKEVIKEVIIDKKTYNIVHGLKKETCKEHSIVNLIKKIKEHYV